MNNEAILKKVIEKAVKNGFSAYAKNRKEGSLTEESMPQIVSGLIEEYGNALIFSHSFAKAFWGDKISSRSEDKSKNSFYEWEYHIQAMVLEEEPLKYLEKWLD